MSPMVLKQPSEYALFRCKILLHHPLIYLHTDNQPDGSGHARLVRVSVRRPLHPALARAARQRRLHHEHRRPARPDAESGRPAEGGAEAVRPHQGRRLQGHHQHEQACGQPIGSVPRLAQSRNLKCNSNK